MTNASEHAADAPPNWWILVTVGVGTFMSALDGSVTNTVWSGALSDRVGTSLPATTGMGILTLGTLLLTRLGPHTALHTVAGALAVAGLGVGVFLSPNNSALMGAAPRAAQGVASGVRATARNLGNVLGVGATGAVYSSTLAHAEAFAAFHAGVLAVCAAAALGALTSAVRGRAAFRLSG